MCHERETYVDLCLSGHILADKIDDYVDEWHESEYNCSLAEYLGLTDDEYALWVEQPATLGMILHARKRRRKLSDYKTSSRVHTLAARTVSPQDADVLVEWLKRTGRIKK